MTSKDPTATTPLPRLWVLMGDKPGDNAQLQRIAATLGWPYEVRRVLAQDAFVLGKPRYRASLAHLDSDRSDPLEPPWPDLILSVGRRPSMAALWIREQSAGHSRIILLGRPRRRAQDYALIIAPGQYRLPASPRVLPIQLPLMACDPQAVAAARARWRETFAGLPRPLTGVLLGGPTKPYRFDAAVVERLLAQLQQQFPQGSVFISTSRRTPLAVIEALQSRLPPRATLYTWDSEKTDNPYLALLGEAEQLVVSSDSISMMVEVLRLGKPLVVFPLPARQPRRHGILRRLLNGLLPTADGQSPPLAPLAKLLSPLGLDCGVRDMDGFHELLIRQGLAVPLGRTPFSPPAVADELPRVVAAIKALWAA